MGETVNRQLELVIQERQERDNKIKELEKEIRQMKVDGNQEDRKLEELNERCTRKQTEIDRIRQREKYYRLKCDTLEGELKEQDQQQKEEEPESTDKSEDELTQHIIELQYRNDILEERLAESNTVELYDEYTKQYTPETERCVQSLLTHNVALNRVGDVITDVLKLVEKSSK